MTFSILYWCSLIVFGGEGGPITRKINALRSPNYEPREILVQPITKFVTQPFMCRASTDLLLVNNARITRTVPSLLFERGKKKSSFFFFFFLFLFFFFFFFFFERSSYRKREFPAISKITIVPFIR